MKFALVEDWKLILKKAWSVRLMLLAGVFDIAERALPYMAQDLIPAGLLGAISLVVLVGAAVSRVMVQKEVARADLSPAKTEPK